MADLRKRLADLGVVDVDEAIKIANAAPKTDMNIDDLCSHILEGIKQNTKLFRDNSCIRIKGKSKQAFINSAIRLGEKEHKIERLLEILKHDLMSPVKSWRLERRLDIKGIEVRALVHQSRMDGEPIGSGYHGYFYCNTPEDLDSTIEHIQGRFNSLNRILIALRKTQSRLRDNQTTLNL